MNVSRIMALFMTAVAASLSIGVAEAQKVTNTTPNVRGHTSRMVDPERPTVTAATRRANREEGGIAAVTTLLNECFESFAPGTLNGQNGWATGGTAATTIVGGSLIEGAQSAQIALGVGTAVSGGDSPDFGPLPDDRFVSEFRGRLSSVAGSPTDAMEFRALDITNNVYTSRARVLGTGAIEVRTLNAGGTAFIWAPTGQSVTAGQVFTLRLEYDVSKDAGQGLNNGRARWYRDGSTTPLFTADGSGGVATELLEVVKVDQMAPVNFDCLNLGRVPGSCEADVAGFNGQVEVLDLLAVINTWGPCPAAPGLCDANIVPNSPGPQAVDVVDLLAVINTWGQCPFPTGACCVGTSCQVMTFNACVAANGTAYFGNDSVCLPGDCQPANNDLIAGAIDVTANINGATVNGNNGTATPPQHDGNPAGADPEIPVGSPTCQWNATPTDVHNTVWYKFTAPVSGNVTLHLCASAGINDPIIAVFSGTPGSLVEVACDDDTCSPTAPPYTSREVVTGLTSGSVYYLMVGSTGSYGGSIPGAFVLTATSP